jgi:hypothetical protein
MQSEHQHIDEFFRSKEGEWEAGGSDLQRDWQQMLILMPPTVTGVDSKPAYYRLLKFAGKVLGGAVTLAVLVALLIMISKRKENITEKKAQKNEAAVAVVTEPTSKQDTVSTVQANPSSASASVTAPAPVQQKLNAFRRNQTQTQDPPTVTDSGAVVEDVVKPDAATMMKEFYDAIKKESQAYTISADRDTTIKGKEGTLLTIKAYTFSDDSGPVKTGQVRITLTEFYQNDDIVAAKLSTTSNGEQLVTGGMIHLAAEKNGRPVSVTPGRDIQVKMPTNNYDERMQLFADARQADTVPVRQRRGNSDTARAGNNPDGSLVNWMPAGQSQMIFGREEEGGISLLDLSVDPFRVRYGDRTVAKFFYDKELRPDKDELREKLYKRYGTYYDKIILRKAGKRERRNTIDTVKMTLQDAMAARLLSKEDGLLYAKKKRRDSVNYSNRLKTLKYYNFSLPRTGWFNCDYFALDPRPKVNFTIDLGEGNEAGAFVSHLVFTRVRSAFSGYYSGNKIQFRGIPGDEPVWVVCAGVKDGKMVSFIAPFNSSSRQVKVPVLEETSPEAFQQKLQMLNQLNAPK